ncbi:hypothetical protein Taro_000023 [Colocasia esculenta]|uniref:50S ribosomal protein 6, chloroplastic n=1 Tax=Colocasia esculenta TaxID=4460 RepID=A0A843TB06_COLES|nr:hypothetical protein [Colocasia esculenta]
MSVPGMLVASGPPSVASSRAVAPPPSLWVGGWKEKDATLGGGRTAAAVVECSSRPKKKATSHHMKSRPKKTQPWDIRRKGPTAYPPLPPLPPDWTLASSQDPAQEQQLLQLSRRLLCPFGLNSLWLEGSEEWEEFGRGHRLLLSACSLHVCCFVQKEQKTFSLQTGETLASPSKTN